MVNRSGVEYLLDFSVYLIALFVAIMGLVVGFLFNAILNFRRALLLYVLGHLSVLFFCFWYTSPQSSVLADEIPRVIYPVMNTADSNASTAGSSDGHRYDPYITRVKQKMVYYYPDKDFEYYALYMAYPDCGHIPGDTAVGCYVLYSMAHESLEYYFDHYVVTPSDFRVLAHQISARDPKYAEVSAKIVSSDSLLNALKKEYDIR
jgi:hypothetical protein